MRVQCVHKNAIGTPDNGLRLRSGNRNITALHGDIQYALPLVSIELLALLHATHDVSLESRP